MPFLIQASKLLGVDVGQFAEMPALLAADRFGGFGISQPAEASLWSTWLTEAGDAPRVTAICLAVMRRPRSAAIWAVRIYASEARAALLPMRSHMLIIEAWQFG